MLPVLDQEGNVPEHVFPAETLLQIFSADDLVRRRNVHREAEPYSIRLSFRRDKILPEPVDLLLL